MCILCVYDERFEPSSLCGSLREHGEHPWTSQSTGQVLICPGHTPKRSGPPAWLIEGNQKVEREAW